MRVVSSVLALAYSVAFVAVCLGACLGGATDMHACCKQGEGFTAADATSSDCCTVISGVSSKVTAGLAMMPDVVATSVPRSFAPPRPVRLLVFAAPLASSPPLVLRI